MGGDRPECETSTSDWSPSFSPVTGVTSMLCHSGLCDAVDIAGIHIEVKVTTYIQLPSQQRSVCPATAQEGAQEARLLRSKLCHHMHVLIVLGSAKKVVVGADHA